MRYRVGERRLDRGSVVRRVLRRRVVGRGRVRVRVVVGVKMRRHFASHNHQLLLFLLTPVHLHVTRV